MKKLQSNFTTPEQSKRLLELGIPADSADCHFCRNIKNVKNEWAPYIYVSSHDTLAEERKLMPHLELYPCWSVGRLIEIWLHCNKFSIGSTSEPITIGLIDFSDNFIDDFIHLIKKLSIQNILTFQN